MRGNQSIAACLLLGLSITSSPQSARQEAQTPASPPAAETPLPAGAVKLGAALWEEASEPLKKWAHSYFEKQMRPRAVDVKAIRAAAGERFPGVTPDAREAVTFLLLYLAYKDTEGDAQAMSFRIREIDRETAKLNQEVDALNRAPEVGKASADAEAMQREDRLRQLAMERQLDARRAAADQKKVSAYLKELGALYPRAKSISPPILRDVK